MQSDNFTKVPNKFLEAIASNRSFCAKTRVLAVILRKTAGWNKKSDWISLSQFESMTGILKRNVCRALEQLLDRKIILKSENKYCINSITKAWREFSKMRTVLKYENSDSQNGEKAFSNMTPTKETLTKDSLLQKKSKSVLMSEKDFEIFWKEYPKKANKKKARERFLKLKSELLPVILEALKKQKASPAWQENSGQFIPHPATWLNGERWEDDIQSLSFTNSKDEAWKKRAGSGYVSTEGHADLIV